MTSAPPFELRARAIAHSNIALAKYWGKSTRGDNLTAVPSLSMTLDALSSRTEVRFDARLSQDELMLNGKELGERELERVAALLQRVRIASGLQHFARVESENNFPTAAGLASSASGFAALALAALGATGRPFTTWQASRLARQSSASAARSLFGGFVELGTEAEAGSPYLPGSHWDLTMLVAVIEDAKKPVSSTLGMEHTRQTSPFYSAWVKAAPETFAEVRDALKAREFAVLARAMEHSTLAMHATMSSAKPPVLYFRGPSTELIHAIRARREKGYPESFTLDAGPNVKLLTLTEHAGRAEEFLRGFPGVNAVLRAKPGPSASLLSLENTLGEAKRLELAEQVG